MFLIKILPGMLWGKMFGRRKALAGGFLMSSRLSLIIAASKIGLDFGIITPGINAAFVLMAVLTCLISPLLFNHLHPANILQGDKHIIVGGSSTAVLLARRLKLHGKKAVLVEKDPVRYKNIQEKGLNVVKADGLDNNLYYELGIKPDNYVVVLTDSEDRNTQICQLLRSTYNHENIISKASSARIEYKLSKLQVDYLDSTRIMATTIENLIFRPQTYEALVETFENYQVEDIHLTNKKTAGKQIKEIPFHKDGQLILIRKNNKVEIPHGDTLLSEGDVITVMGTESALENIRKTLSYV